MRENETMQRVWDFKILIIQTTVLGRWGGREELQRGQKTRIADTILYGFTHRKHDRQL